SKQRDRWMCERRYQLQDHRIFGSGWYFLIAPSFHLQSPARYCCGSCIGLKMRKSDSGPMMMSSGPFLQVFVVETPKELDSEYLSSTNLYSRPSSDRQKANFRQAKPKQEEDAGAHIVPDSPPSKLSISAWIPVSEEATESIPNLIPSDR
ncbi:hypothetical protein PTTG_25415, partial [Puccinia triticina 1-1 BBBD Race 1]